MKTETFYSNLNAKATCGPWKENLISDWQRKRSPKQNVYTNLIKILALPQNVSSGGLTAAQITWICNKVLNFWSVLLIFACYTLEKFIGVWNYLRQFKNYVKTGEIEIHNLKVIECSKKNVIWADQKKEIFDLENTTSVNRIIMILESKTAQV